MGQLWSNPAPPSNTRDGKIRSKSYQPYPRLQATSREEVDAAKARAQWSEYHQAQFTHNEPRVQNRRTHSTHHLRESNGNTSTRKPQDDARASKTSHRKHPPREGYVRHQNPKADIHPSKSKIKLGKERRLQSSIEPHRSTFTHSRHRQPRPNETKDCMICTDTRSLHRFPNRPPTTQCTHEIDVCRRCLRTWISSEFASKMWDAINCPVCAVGMQYEDMREFAPSEVFRRYDKLSTKAALEAMPGFTWCITRNCKSGQVQDNGTAKFRCVACRKTHCVEHGVAWHKGESCREYDYRTNKKLKKAEEVASKKLINDTTKKCPGCKRSIEKSFGCDHMTCSRCKHEFCWQCLAPYAKKNGGRVIHLSGCDYHNPDWYSD